MNLNNYPLHQSPLYRLTTRKRLAQLLRISVDELDELSSDSNFRVWMDDGRQIESPNARLKPVHKRFAVLLAKVVTPDWLMSGKKGRSYVDNARAHLKSDYALNVDVRGFYKSTTAERVYQLFIHRFLMNHDVAWTLSRLLTWNGIVPTGSPASQLVAFWAFEAKFTKIAELAKERGLIFTVYVDDLTFSGATRISGLLPFELSKELASVGLELKATKTRFFFKNDHKNVTGVGITKDHRLVVPNVQRKKAQILLAQLQASDLGFPEIEVKLRGSLESARQIESDYLNSTYAKVRARANKSKAIQR